jgi:hypothetical protein
VETAKKGKKQSDELLAMQQRVCVVLKQWIAVGYADFSGTLPDAHNRSHKRLISQPRVGGAGEPPVKMKSAMMAFVEGQLTSDYALVKETKDLRTVLQYQMGNEAARKSLFIAVRAHLHLVVHALVSHHMRVSRVPRPLARRGDSLRTCLPRSSRST